METPQKIDEEQVTVQTYKPGVYEPALWPVVETKKLDDAFKPHEYERLSEVTFVVDPMFADFDVEPPVVRVEEVVVEGTDAETEMWSSEPGAMFAPDSDEDALDVAELVEEAESAAQEVVEDVAEPELEIPAKVSVDEDTEKVPSGEDIDARIAAEVEKQLELHAETNAKELERVREEAYAEGATAGRAEMADEKSQVESRYEELFADMQTQLKESLHNTEREAVELAFQVAQKLIGTVLETDREYIREVVAQALQATSGSEVISVRVSPQDFEFLSLNNVAAAIQARRGGSWKFQSDDSIRAGCIVTTAAGEIDFNLDASWARIREKVLRGPKS